MSAADTVFPCSAATRVTILAAAGISAATISSACPTHAVEHPVQISVEHNTTANTAFAKLPAFVITHSFIVEFPPNKKARREPCPIFLSVSSASSVVSPAFLCVPSVPCGYDPYCVNKIGLAPICTVPPLRGIPLPPASVKYCVNRGS